MKKQALNDRQKIIIISDTHLTRHFDERKYEFLVKIISNADKVIINGDLWDGWFISFEEFIKSKWNRLFPYLLEKNAVYIYGNHDPKEKNSGNLDLFSAKNTDIYTTKINNEVFTFEHGRRILDINDSYYSKMYNKMLRFADVKNVKIIYHFLNGLEVIGFKMLGSNLMSNSEFARKRNLKLKKYLKNEWLICGDTHCPEVDTHNKFANSGCIMCGFGSYLMIEDGEIKLIKEKYY